MLYYFPYLRQQHSLLPFCKLFLFLCIIFRQLFVNSTLPLSVAAVTYLYFLLTHGGNFLNLNLIYINCNFFKFYAPLIFDTRILTNKCGTNSNSSWQKVNKSDSREKQVALIFFSRFPFT